MPYTGILGTAGIAKESVAGTFVAPTEFLRFMPPFQFSTDINLIEAQGVSSRPDIVSKVAQGKGLLKSGKFKTEVEPENIGNHLMAAFGTDTKTGPTDTTAYTHAFTRLSSASLPTYSWWQAPAGTLTYPQHAGCMLNKLEFDIKAGEFVVVDADWIGMNYTSGGVTHAASFSALQPFKFDQAILKIPGGGSQIKNYDQIKVTFDNMVEPVHALSSSIYATKIISRGFRVSVTASLIVEDVTEWSNFINGTASSFNLAITSSQLVTGAASTYNSLTFDIPTMSYQAAPFPIAKDLMKIVFAAVGVYNVSSAYTGKATLINSVSAAY